MDSLVIEALPTIRDVEVTEKYLRVVLSDERLLLVPLSWYPRLAEAAREELVQWELFAEDTAIEWPLLDEHVGVDGLLAGRRSQESTASLERWRQQRMQ